MDTYLKRYLWIIHLCLIVTVGHSASMLINHLLVNKSHSELSKLLATNNAKAKKVKKTVRVKSKKWANVIAQRNLFNANPPSLEAANKKKASAQEDEETKNKGELPKPHEECEDSGLKVTVKVTMVAEPVEASYAMIDVDNQHRIYRVGDLIEEQEVVGEDFCSVRARQAGSSPGVASRP